MQKLTIFLVALATICLCDAKYFATQCDLVRELRRQGFPEDKMRDSFGYPLRDLKMTAGSILSIQGVSDMDAQTSTMDPVHDSGLPGGGIFGVCLIDNESGRRTDKMGTVNKNGSRDYGLFQINDKYWCSKTSTPGKDCNVTCAQMMLDDITLASTCAKKVYKRHKFEAWYGWKNHCKGKPLPDISKC